MKKFIKKHKAAFIRTVLIAVLTLVTYIVLHRIGTAERGYEAIGGEAFAFLIPYFIWVANKFKKPIKEVGDNELEQ